MSQLTPNNRENYLKAVAHLMGHLATDVAKPINILNWCQRYGVKPSLIDALRDLDAVVCDLTKSDTDTIYLKRTAKLPKLTPEEIFSTQKGLGPKRRHAAAKEGLITVTAVSETSTVTLDPSEPEIVAEVPTNEDRIDMDEAFGRVLADQPAPVTTDELEQWRSVEPASIIIVSSEIRSIGDVGMDVEGLDESLMLVDQAEQEASYDASDYVERPANVDQWPEEDPKPDSPTVIEAPKEEPVLVPTQPALPEGVFRGDMKLTYCQSADDYDEEGDQDLEMRAIWTPGGEHFYTLTTRRWAVNSISDLQAILSDFQVFIQHLQNP